VEQARREQGQKLGVGLGRRISAREQGVLPHQRDDPKSPLGEVVVDRHRGVGQEQLQGLALVDDVYPRR